MKGSTIFVLVIVLYGIFGDLYFRQFFHTLGIVITFLFVLFLIIYHRLDHKGVFWPKKKDKEG